jgi:CheY-like chemotaxis protein
MNLITNASESLEERPGRITLKTGIIAGSGAARGLVYGERLAGKRCIFLEVADTGCGMDEATQKRIFDPFFTTKATGRGLGLAAVLGIVRGHGGAIRVDSAKGRGTTVEVRFPASGAPLPPKSVSPVAATRGRAPGDVVLVVDDEQSVRNVSRAMLERLGFKAVLAESGREAMEIVRTQGRKLTCALLDLTMPGEKGDAVFAALRQLEPDLPILVSSGWHESEAVPRLGAAGHCRFLQKPYATRDLGEALDLLLGGNEMTTT